MCSLLDTSYSVVKPSLDAGSSTPLGLLFVVPALSSATFIILPVTSLDQYYMPLIHFKPDDSAAA